MMKLKVLPFTLLSVMLVLSAAGVSAQDDVTLTVWDNFTREAEQPMIEQLNQEFMEAHPGVTIVRETYDTSNLTELLPLALTESTGPDVAMINQGIANMGALVEAGLLLPLDEYAEEFGWLDRYGEGLHRRNRFTEGAEQFGEGNLFGVSNTAEVVGVFYHEDIFDDLGLEVPTTLDEFESVAQTLIDAGITPIAFGSLDGWPAIHEFSGIHNAYITPEALDALIYRFEDGTFDLEASLQAAAQLQDWVEAGYFPEGFEGMDYDNATTAAFVNKDAAMWLTGNWVTPTILDQLGEDNQVGFFLMPGLESGEVPLTTGGVGLAYGIRATSDQTDLAAAYIDFITGPRAAEIFVQNGLIPAMPVDPAILEEGTLFADVVNAWGTIAASDRVGHYLDWTIPGDELVASLQELLGGVITPEEFVADVEQVYVESAP